MNIMNLVTCHQLERKSLNIVSNMKIETLQNVGRKWNDNSDQALFSIMLRLINWDTL